MLFNSCRRLLKLLNKQAFNLNHPHFQYTTTIAKQPVSNDATKFSKSNPVIGAVNETDHYNDNELNWTAEIHKLKADEPRSLIEPLENDTFDVANTAHPNVQPSFNLAAYVSKSATLQRLVLLGVDLHRIEKKPGVAEFIVKLEFETDVQPYLKFFHDIGIVADDFGWMITRNPLIFTQNLSDLETRVNYLKSKTFKRTDIARICERNPFWLMYQTQRIDRRLGYFQSTFSLAGPEVRYLATKQSKLITYGLEAIRQNTFSIREEMGFDETETKNLLLSIPRIWMMSESCFDRDFCFLF